MGRARIGMSLAHGNSRHCILGICPAHADAQRYHFWKAHAERSLARVGTEYRTGVLRCATHGWHTRAQNCGLAALAMSLDRFNQALEAVASFKDCQQVLTVGNLDGIETSIRRMNRTERLATIRVAYHGQNVICLDVYGSAACRHDRRCRSAHPGGLSNPIGRPACAQGESLVVECAFDDLPIGQRDGERLANIGGDPRYVSSDLHSSVIPTRRTQYWPPRAVSSI
jgi:hypothetical protein